MKQLTTPKVLLAASISMLMHAAAAQTPFNENQEEMPSATLETIELVAKRDLLLTEISEEDVYDKNESSTYKDKEELERFMGESPADIFKGMIGVESGDARNSGAIDPNVRGIQGQGRVPVTIDGTEQAITVYRGYNGANNRNYIDPLLISNVKVSKGPSMEKGIRSSVGGAVTINTLNVDDVLRGGENFGFSIKGIVGNNATDANAIDYNSVDVIHAEDNDLYPVQDQYNPDLYEEGSYQRQSAEQLRDIFLNLSGELPRKSNLGIETSKVADNRSNPLSIGDKAVRIAMAGRSEIGGIKVDGLAAYTRRNRGNYYAGKHNSDDYRTDVDRNNRKTGDFTAYMADVYLPGREVPNTSNESDSYLLKGSIRPSDDQAIQLGYRHSETTYGDIMPSRVAGESIKGGLYDVTGRVPQWPLSNVEIDAANIKYRFDPKNNKWVDLTANLWQTESQINSNNSGGYPYFLVGPPSYSIFSNPDALTAYIDALTDRYGDRFPEVANCGQNPYNLYNPYTLCGQLSTLYGANTIKKADAYMQTHNDRVGISLSNTAQITDQLDATVSGNWQKEKLETDEIQDKAAFSFVALPRKGRREEWNIGTVLNWQPSDKWRVQAGLDYKEYWTFDDLVNEGRKEGKYPNKGQKLSGIKINYYEKANQTIQDAYQSYKNGDSSYYDYTNTFRNETGSYPNYGSAQGEVSDIEGGNEGTIYLKKDFVWQADDKGNLSRDSNIFFNGEAKANGWLPPAKLKEIGTSGVLKGSGGGIPIYEDSTVGDRLQSLQKVKDHALDPSLALSYKINDGARVYARYAQTTRMPSIYEATLGFSLLPGGFGEHVDDSSPVKPEKGTNFEIGYVQDLTPWLKDARHADFKLAFFNNRIDDVIDRNAEFKLQNFDHQTIQGLEVQSRYDNGDWFGDLSFTHNFKNEVCDAQYAMQEDPYYGQVPDCVKYGFNFGYLQNMGQPDWQTDLTLGKRLMDEKLTIGTRLHYHSGADKEMNVSNYGNSNEGVSIFNTPLDWSDVLTVDGFMNYKVNDNMFFELTGANLTDQYYIDPLSRSLMPAPGRSVTAKAEFKF